MNKELEALERLKTAPSFMGGTREYRLSLQSDSVLLEDYETVKSALLELKAIKEAKPSVALKDFQYLIDCNFGLKFSINIREQNCKSNVRQSLIKAQEQEKENELLKEIIKIFFDKGSPLHQYDDKDFGLTIEVDDECSIMHLGNYKGIDLNKKLKEVLESNE